MPAAGGAPRRLYGGRAGTGWSPAAPGHVQHPIGLLARIAHGKALEDLQPAALKHNPAPPLSTFQSFVRLH